MTGNLAVAILTNVSSPRIGGISGYVGDLAAGLKDQGFEVRIISMPEAFNEFDEIARGRKGWWRTIHLLFVSLFLTSAIARILSLRMHTEHVIVHSHSASYCLFLGRLAQLWGCHSVHTFHSPLEVRNRALRLLAPKLDALVFVSHALRTQYESLGVSSANTWLVPGAVNLQRYRPPTPEEKSAARASVGNSFPDRRAPGRLVLYVGRIVPEKGTDVLLAACSIVAPSNPELRTLIVGPLDISAEGVAFLARCQKMLVELGLREQVVMLGPLSPSALCNAYWAADLFVCPSTWPDPAPLVVSEAMACGLPVIASDTGGLPERVDDHTNGRLVPPRDAKALASAIVDVSHDPKLLSNYSRNARQRAVRDLGTDTLLVRHVALYESLLRGSSDRDGAESTTLDAGSGTRRG